MENDKLNIEKVESELIVFANEANNFLHDKTNISSLTETAKLGIVVGYLFALKDCGIYTKEEVFEKMFNSVQVKTELKEKVEKL